MLTLFSRHRVVLKLIVLVSLTGCASVSKHSASDDLPPLDLGVPLETYLQESSKSGFVPAISKQAAHQSAGNFPDSKSQTCQPNLIKATDGIPSISELNAQTAQTCKDGTSENGADCQTEDMAKPEIDDCLPLLNQWKSEYEMQSQITDEKLKMLQETLRTNHEKLMKMEAEQVLANSEIARLQTQLNSYQKEVFRLEHLMHTQHSADLVLLDSLSAQLGGLLERAKNESN